MSGNNDYDVGGAGNQGAGNAGGANIGGGGNIAG